MAQATFCPFLKVTSGFSSVSVTVWSQTQKQNYPEMQDSSTVVENIKVHSLSNEGPKPYVIYFEDVSLTLM